MNFNIPLDGYRIMQLWSEFITPQSTRQSWWYVQAFNGSPLSFALVHVVEVIVSWAAGDKCSW